MTFISIFNVSDGSPNLLIKIYSLYYHMKSDVVVVVRVVE